MNIKQRWSSPCRAVLAGLGCLSIVAAPAHAQFTADYQTNTIDGVVSNWTGNGTYVVGSNNVSDALQIINGGALLLQPLVLDNPGSGFIGYEPGASNNSVLVSGSGSAWTSRLLKKPCFEKLTLDFIGLFA